MFAAAVLTLSAANAHASLIDDDVSVQYLAGSSVGSVMTATVGSGVEFTLFGLEFDLDASSIHISNSTTGTVRFPFSSQESFVISDLEWRNSGVVDPTAFITDLVVMPSFVDFDADAGPMPVPFGDANVTFTDHSITIDMAGYVFDPETTLDITIITNHTPVPEPVTLALFGLGLASLGVATRRRPRC